MSYIKRHMEDMAQEIAEQVLEYLPKTIELTPPHPIFALLEEDVKAIHDGIKTVEDAISFHEGCVRGYESVMVAYLWRYAKARWEADAEEPLGDYFQTVEFMVKDMIRARDTSNLKESIKLSTPELKGMN